MNKRIYSITIGILLFLMLAGVCYIGFHFIQMGIVDARQDDNIESYVVKNEIYGVALKEEIEEINPFNTTVNVSVYRHKDGLLETYFAEFDTTINTSGKELSEDNFRVTYNDEYVMVELYDKNGNLEQKHRFYYEDLVEDKGRMQ